MSCVQSCDWIFVFSCWIWACACICAIAWSSLGAQLTHRPRSVFQQTWSHTHVATQAEQPPAEAGHRVLERRGIAVAATAAVKLELVPVVAAAVRVIVGEEDHPGHGDSPRSCVHGNRSNSAGHRTAQRGNNPSFSHFLADFV